MRRTAPLVLVAACIAACGLKVVGSATVGVEPTDGGGGSSEASASPSDSSIAAETSDVDAYTDAGLPCEIAIDDPLTGDLTARWYLAANAANAGYPKLDAPSPSMPAPMLALVKDNASNARGGIWLKSAVPLEAFDIDFDFRVICTVIGCADGFAAAWVDTTDPAKLDAGQSGGALGLPPASRGSAVQIDLYRNDALGDDMPPTLSVIDLDPNAVPGSYEWVKHSQSVPTVGSSGRIVFHLSFHVRDGKLSVALGNDGGTSIATSGTSVTTLTSGSFGITGATGGAVSGRFNVSNLHARFYRCAAPPLH